MSQELMQSSGYILLFFFLILTKNGIGQKIELPGMK